MTTPPPHTQPDTEPNTLSALRDRVLKAVNASELGVIHEMHAAPRPLWTLPCGCLVEGEQLNFYTSSALEPPTIADENPAHDVLTAYQQFYHRYLRRAHRQVDDTN